MDGNHSISRPSIGEVCGVLAPRNATRAFRVDLNALRALGVDSCDLHSKLAGFEYPSVKPIISSIGALKANIASTGFLHILKRN